MTLIENLQPILFNPYLLLFIGVGWTVIIITKLNIHWKIKYYFEDKQTLKLMTDAEIKEDYERHLRIQKEMKEKYTDYDDSENRCWFRSWSKKIKDEYFKRGLQSLSNVEVKEN